MKRLLFCVTLLSVSLAGCGGRSASSGSDSSQPATGLHDLSSTSSSSAETANSSVKETNTAQARVTDLEGGGGGGRESVGVLKQNISLALTTAASVDTARTDRKVIRNAELNLEADNPEDAHRKITAIAELRGGFVVESQQSSSEIQSTTRDIITMTVRVPSERFSETLADIRNTSTRVVLETVKGQDVTEEFIDIEAQLRAKRALELQFMEIMKRANSVEDALYVQSQLAAVRGEIERTEGRKRFLENQSSLSTIKVRLQTAKVFAASSVGYGERLAGSFYSGADVALNFVLGLVTFLVAALPFAIFFGLPAFLFIRYVLRRQDRPKSVAEIANDEI